MIDILDILEAAPPFQFATTPAPSGKGVGGVDPLLESTLAEKRRRERRRRRNEEALILLLLE